MAENHTRRNFLRLFGATAATSAAGTGCIAIPAVQRKIIYSPNGDFEGNDLPAIQEPEAYGIKNAVSEVLTTEKGHRFLTWHTTSMDPTHKTLVFFPGNGGHLGFSPAKGPAGEALWNGTDAYIKLFKQAQQQGFQVVFAQQVGFAGSNTQHPTEDNMYEGARRTIGWLLEKGFTPNTMKIAGVSMGTALAAHAANHLVHHSAFTDSPQQHIQLTLASGLIDVQAGIKEAVPVIAPITEIVLKDRLSTGKELEAMASTGQGNRIHVTFIRSKQDALTPASQSELHAKAANGLDFVAQEVDGMHFPSPDLLLNSFKKSQRYRTEELKASR
jgi:hypothetical protein